MKELMRKCILALQKDYRVTNYLYTDLHLNPGNLNAWLKHSDSGKNSFISVRRLISYVQHKASLAVRQYHIMI